MIWGQLLSPALVDLWAFLMHALQTGACLIQVGGLAEVSYPGRAASMAEVGPYLVITKRDSSLQTSCAEGREAAELAAEDG
ncbi:hypothetical protein [Deinococcus aquatilis]|uniref:hypothetical protein n=1 Tax=Deinococcus aquatilis TaxID=519440 RepID=UPI000360D339|nr:hypothetical protein [Deinococcus aquatilis]